MRRRTRRGKEEGSWPPRTSGATPTTASRASTPRRGLHHRRKRREQKRDRTINVVCNQFPTGTNVRVIQGTYGLGFVAENQEPLSEATVRACQEINARTTAASSSEAMPRAQPGTPVSAHDTPAAPGDDGGRDWWRARGGWYLPPIPSPSLSQPQPPHAPVCRMLSRRS